MLDVKMINGSRGDAENGRDAIDGEKHVGAFHDQQDQQRRRDPQPPRLPHEEAAAVVHRRGFRGMGGL